MMKKILKDNGFSLIEMLVAIAVVGLIITAILNINLAGWKFWNFNRDRVDLINQARLLTTNLERQIRTADFISAVDSDGDSVNEKLILSSDGTKYFIIDESSDYGKLQWISGGNTRNITDEIILKDSYNIEIISDNDKDVVHFNFKLAKENVTHEISNRFFSRVIN